MWSKDGRTWTVKNEFEKNCLAVSANCSWTYSSLTRLIKGAEKRRRLDLEKLWHLTSGESPKDAMAMEWPMHWWRLTVAVVGGWSTIENPANPPLCSHDHGLKLESKSVNGKTGYLHFDISGHFGCIIVKIFLPKNVSFFCCKIQEIFLPFCPSYQRSDFKHWKRPVSKDNLPPHSALYRSTFDSAQVLSFKLIIHQLSIYICVSHIV